MTQLIGLSGSLRRGSFNTALLHAAVALLPAGATLSVKTIHGIPLYNEDDEASTGIPELVKELKESIADADGLLLSTPEYNGSLPGVFKNAIDWLSRPGSDIPRIFGGKPVAIIGASAGNLGTVLSQNAWLPVLRALGVKPWFEDRLLVSQAYQQFAADGTIATASLELQLRQFVTGFVGFVGEQNR